MSTERNKNRPRIKIEIESIDKILELIGLIGLLLLIGLPIYYFNKLPDSIPGHFGADGQPDGFGGKGIIWTIPIVGTVMYFGMYWLNKYPHVFNYPQKVTEQNAERLYKTATRMIRVFNSLITCALAYITYSTIQTALGNQNGLGKFFLPTFMILIFGVAGFSLYKSIK